MLRILLTSCLGLLVTATLFSQPANDDCAAAQAILLDEVVAFSTLDATDNGPAHPGCFGDNDSIPADIWFTYTPANDMVLNWSNCGTADYDSRMAVYAADDPCLASDDNLIECNDDGAGCDLFTSDMSFFATGGQQLVFRLGGFSGTDTTFTSGSGTVVLSEITNSPINDFCNGAIAIDLGVDQAFSTENALTDGPDHPDNPCFGFGSVTAGADIWYTFTPDFNGFVQWSTCNSANYDTRLAIYDPGSACPPTDADLYSCNDDGAGCANYSSLVTFPVISGQTYLLRLGGFAGASGTGTFNLEQVMPPPAPDNDACAAAEPVPMIITYEQADDGDLSGSGTTESATFVSEDYVFPQCLGNQNGGEFADVWYSFETFGNTEMRIGLLAAGQGQNPATSFFLDLFYECGVQVDSTEIAGSCISTSEDNLFAETTITGLPDTSITLLMRVTTRLTSELPGEFAYFVAGAIISDVEELSIATNLELFPNPVNDRATVRFHLTEATQLDVSVFDVMGRRVQQQRLGLLPSGAQQFQLETSQLAAGVYSLHLTNGQAVQTLKFIVN